MKEGIGQDEQDGQDQEKRVMKKKQFYAMILILLALAMLALFVAPWDRVSGEYDGATPTEWGYPIPWADPTSWGYPAPATPTIDPWCEEARLLGKGSTWWCIPTPEYIAEKPDSRPQPTETPMQVMERRVDGVRRVKSVKKGN